MGPTKSTKRSGRSNITPKEPLDAVPPILLERIQKIIVDHRLAPRAVSEQAGLSPTYLFDLLGGRSKRPMIQSLQAIAKVLGVRLAYLLGEVNDPDLVNGNSSPRPIRSIPLVGVAETGAFRKPVMQAHSSHFPLLQRPLSQAHPDAKHFALTMGDEAMNVGGREGPVFPGNEVLCVDMMDADLTVNDGRIYAVRRTPDNGRTWETLIRRARVYRDRTELVPESSQPFEKIVVRGGLGTDPTDQIHAIGWVYGIFRSCE